MENIILNIKNCNNIDDASIAIQANKINIKYGINGTGKSTIVKAIQLAVEPKSDLSELIPFKYRADKKNKNQPVVAGLDECKSVEIFNEDYVAKILFKKDEVMENSFGIFIETPDYVEKMTEIDTLVSGIKDTFKNDENIESVIQDLSLLSASFGNSSTGMHASGKLSKAVANGNPLENIPEQLTAYKYFLTLPDSQNVQWLGWHNKGESYSALSDDCPYCTSPTVLKKDVINSIKQEYNATNIGHLTEIIKILESLGGYFSPDTRMSLQEIISNSGKISDAQKTYLGSIRPEVESLRKSLTDLKNISFFSFNNTEDVKEKINEFRVDLKFLTHLQSDPAKDIVDRVNGALDEVGEKIGLLQGQIAQQKRGIEKTIKMHTTEINEFLLYAGYKYQVDIQEDSNSYKMKFFHKDHSVHIEQSSKHLSYGERNAFALVLFMYECISKKPDLVILDDPISSFDKNKKFAIAEKIFRGKQSFQNMTVLLVTHDIEPIIDMVKVHSQNYAQFLSSYFLENNDGAISEIPIAASDIKSFGNVCMSNIARVQDDIIRSIYLRRYYEILNNKGNAYHVLASLIKKRTAPTLDKEGDIVMPESDRLAAISEIQEDIAGFDYDVIVSRLNDGATIREMYKHSTNNYEKIQLFRIIVQDDRDSEIHENSHIRKFINETFHIENEFVMQLDPSKYSPVPQHIIEECNRALAERYNN